MVTGAKIDTSPSSTNFTPSEIKVQGASTYAAPTPSPEQRDDEIISPEPVVSEYRCSQCSQTRNTRALINRHVNTHILPYRCTFPGCGAGKATQRDLDRHHDTHGKIRQYFCPVPGCPWHPNGIKGGFSRRLDNAKRHLKSHTNNQGLSVLREDSQGRLSRV